ncbi:hypothetical protein BCR32DRAFT_295841 [Anaeromyces robustus]|uniref:Uncharacterized protein n=1 Tax=Anaeromyces robustus TaxID=1754192 RepID=A0A1Y1WV45_9FUNG|nr:hypothetical protein BCR32DRAFT_295841 [Anaeromyces robustus]|eukprot:ORX77086.1 hypothetical protein BCR32DRAFT_295841 [Anaeromyces robustus]
MGLNNLINNNNINKGLEINKMKIEKNCNEVQSQITKKLNEVRMGDTNKEKKQESKQNICNSENNFINKIGISMTNPLNNIKINKNIIKKNDEKKHDSKNFFENSEEQNNLPSFNFDNSHLNNMVENIPRSNNNVIELKTFKKTENKYSDSNVQDNIFNVSSVNIEDNIFAYNTYNEKYINEDEYISDSSSDYLSTSPFKYENVTGVNIPNRNINSDYNKIASPQPESKFNIGSTIESFNEIANFIYENDENQNQNEDNKFISNNNNYIRKNDSFIKNYLDHTRFDNDKRKIYDSKSKNDFDSNYITFKSLSNKKINSNDVIDRGCLCSSVNLDDYLIKKNHKNEQKNEKINRKNINLFDYVNVFELDNLNNQVQSMPNLEEDHKEYILTEYHDNMAKDEEPSTIKNEEYCKKDLQDIQSIDLNQKNIYDNYINYLS